ncbi:esterase family protein [bacterium]|nr:esterase family protein [bacterium]
MKKLLLLFFLLAAAFASKAATLKTYEMDSKVLNAKRTYVVLFPDAYESDTNAFFPVLYTLHGLGDKPENWYKNIPMPDMMEEMITKGEIKPFVMVTVQAMGNDDKEGIGYFDQPGWKAQTFYFEEFIPEIEKQFRVRKDKGGRALTGISMGGGGALSYAYQHPEMFSSVYAMSPWVNSTRWYPEAPFGTPLFNLGRSVLAFDTANFIRRASEEKKEQLRTVKWFVHIGDDDFLFECASDFHTAMREAGIKCEFRVADGNHSWHYWNRIAPEMLKFTSDNFKDE